MKGKRRHLAIVCLIVSVLLLGVIMLQGCKKSDSGGGTEQETKMWACPKHPDMTANRPTKCPRCGMDLVPLEAKEE
ncbi:MAG: hypothetical protein OEW48_11510 [Phycisphaerae bacterium]|nr:hypothetical protein [Phycisphaerae bacterium]